MDAGLAQVLPARQAATVRALADGYNRAVNHVTAVATQRFGVVAKPTAPRGRQVDAMPGDPGAGGGGGGRGRGGSAPTCGADSPHVQWWGFTLRFSHCLVNLMATGAVTAAVLVVLLGLAALLAPTVIGVLGILAVAVGFLTDAKNLLNFDAQCGYRGVNVNITWIIVGTNYSTVC